MKHQNPYRKLFNSLSEVESHELSDLSFRIVDQSRYQEVLDLLYANFHQDEPMSRALKIYDGVNRVPEADQYALDALTQNLSIMAIDPVTSLSRVSSIRGDNEFLLSPRIQITNQLLGVSINGLTKKSETDRSTPATSEKFRHILTVLRRVNSRAPRLFEDHGTEVFFDIKIVTTDKSNRKRGLGTDLIRKSVELARSLGMKACKTEATGMYSRKAFERIGFVAQAEYAYSEYERGIFDEIKTHKCTTLLTLRLHPKYKGPITE